MKYIFFTLLLLKPILSLALVGGVPIPVADEAYWAMKRGDYSEQDFVKLKHGSTEDYFQDMDKGITRPERADALRASLEPYIPGITRADAVERVVRGRNNWMLWTGGNDRFWDLFNAATFGGEDFIKTLSNHPRASAVRSQRWQKLGLINEPCFSENKKPREDRYGLYLDTRDSNCPADPFEDATKYPGIKTGSRGKTLKIKINGQVREVTHEVGSFYGYATGVVGLRLFTNPAFDQKAADRWDPERYYNDITYFNDPTLVKPYRVGMACAFCHVGPSPTNPPADFNNPQWANLSANVGGQYFWLDRVFFWRYREDKSNLIHQLLHTQRPGTLDTSLVSSDQINNPRTMNAVYSLGPRAMAAMKFHDAEILRYNERRNNQFSFMDESLIPANSPLRSFYKLGDGNPFEIFWNGEMARPAEVVTPRVLKDGADSVGVLGALNRVYVNIGLYSEEWLKNFIPILGTLGIPGYTITPFPIGFAQLYSKYWQATVDQTPDLALFLVAASAPDHLRDAPGGAKYLQDYNGTVVNRGKQVFAENCAACHSSKQPEQAFAFFQDASCTGRGYLNCWNKYWEYTKTDEYKKDMTKIALQDDFLKSNYLSTDLRVPVTIVGTQICTAVATNGIAGNIWDNFTSTTYKELSPIKQAKIYRPNEDGTAYNPAVIDLPGGGRGYLRPPSLISIWSTAPFFNNNSLGPFKFQGTTAARLESFSTAMDWLLNPDRRGATKSYDEGEKLVKFTVNEKQAQGVVDVFTEDTYIRISRNYLPGYIYALIPADFKYKDTRRQPFRKNLKRQQSAQPLPPRRNAGFFGGLYDKLAGLFKTSPEVGRQVASSDNDDAEYLDNPTEVGEMIKLGPIPKGVPVNLISNIKTEAEFNPDSVDVIGAGHKVDLVFALKGLIDAINATKGMKDREAAAREFMRMAGPGLLKVSKCDDFIVNKGHYFGTAFRNKISQLLSVDDQKALTEFIKHM